MHQFDYIKQGYLGIHDHMIPSMMRTKEPHLRERIVNEINPIIWMVWHILRTEDMYMNTVMFDRVQVYHRENWQEKLEINTSHVGTGMTREQVDELCFQVNSDQLFAYNQTMKKEVLELTENPPIPFDSPLANAEIMKRRLQNSDSFPDSVLENRALAYSPFEVSSGLIGLISHAYMHIGQYFAVTKPL